MSTQDVRIDTDLNKHIWRKGIKSPPTRVRVVIERKQNDDEEAEEKVLIRNYIIGLYYC